MVAPVFNNSEPLTVDEIERLPRWAAVALAARCAMRIAPIAGLSGKFQFWRTEASSNVQAMDFVPFLVAFSSVSGTDQSLHLVKSLVARAGEKAESAGSMAEAAAVAACSRAAAASIAASGKGAAVTRAATAAAVRATDVRAATAAREGLAHIPGIDRRVAAAAARAVQAATKSDCQLISRIIGDNQNENWCTPLDFYEMPLWPHGNLPEGWNQLLSLWEEALTHLNHQGIYERHVTMIQGGPIAWDDMENRLQEWVDSLTRHDVEDAPAPESASRRIYDQDEEDAEESPSATGTQQGAASGGNAPERQAGRQQSSGKSGAAQGSKTGEAAEKSRATGTALPLTDRVAGTDVLGRESLISAIGAMLASPRQSSPFTLGIFGNWGSGKSSVIQQIRSRLSMAPYEGQFDFATFNPWENRHATSIQAEMVKAMVRGLTQGLDRRRRLKLMWEFIRREPRQMVYKTLIGLCFYLAASLMLGIIALALNNPVIHAAYGITFLAGLAGFIWSFWRQIQPAVEQTLPFPVSLRVDLPEKDDPQTTSSSEWKSQLATLCELRLRSDSPNRPRRLIFAIDDIDRCPSEVILETFDSIQLLADLPGVVTIVATDERVALQAIADQYADVEDSERSAAVIAREYLGKLFQATIALSNPSRATIRKFVERWLFPDLSDAAVGVAASESSGTPRVVAPAPGQAPAALTAGTESSTLFNKVVEDPSLPLDAQNITIEQVLQIDMKDTNRDKAMFIDLADLFEFTNPRQLIRLRNAYRLAKAFNRIRRYDSELREFGLSKIMTLLFWEEFLRTQPQQMRQFAGIAIYTNDAIDRASLSAPLVDGINRIRDVFDLSVAEEEDGRRQQFKELNDFVNQFLLPYVLDADPQIHASDRSDRAEEDDEDASPEAVQRTVRLMSRG